MMTTDCQMLLRIDSDIGTSILSYFALVDLSCLVQTCQGFATYLLQSNDDNEEKEGTTTQVTTASTASSSTSSSAKRIWSQALRVATAKYGLSEDLFDEGGWREGKKVMTTDEKEAEWVALHDDEDEEDDEGGRRREGVLSPRHGFSVCGGQDGWCVLFGGVEEKTGDYLNDCYVLKPADARGGRQQHHHHPSSLQSKWHKVIVAPRTRLPHPRAYHDAVIVCGSTLVVWGGLYPEGLRYNDTWVLDLSAVFAYYAAAGIGRKERGGAGGSVDRSLAPPGKIQWIKLSSGGPSNPCPRQGHVFVTAGHYSSLLVRTPKDNAGNHGDAAIGGGAATRKYPSTIVIHGGVGWQGHELRDAWILDLRYGFGSWVKVAINQTGPASRYNHSAVGCTLPFSSSSWMCISNTGSTEGDCVVMAGGKSNDGIFHDVWILDVEERRWQKLSFERIDEEGASPNINTSREEAEQGEYQQLLSLPSMPHVVIGLLEVDEGVRGGAGRAEGGGGRREDLLILNLKDRWMKRIRGLEEGEEVNQEGQDHDERDSSSQPPLLYSSVLRDKAWRAAVRGVGHIVLFGLQQVEADDGRMRRRTLAYPFILSNCLKEPPLPTMSRLGLDDDGGEGERNKMSRRKGRGRLWIQLGRRKGRREGDVEKEVVCAEEEEGVRRLQDMLILHDDAGDDIIDHDELHWQQAEGRERGGVGVVGWKLLGGLGKEGRVLLVQEGGEGGVLKTWELVCR